MPAVISPLSLSAYQIIKLCATQQASVSDSVGNPAGSYFNTANRSLVNCVHVQGLV